MVLVLVDADVATVRAESWPDMSVMLSALTSTTLSGVGMALVKPRMRLSSTQRKVLQCILSDVDEKNDIPSVQKRLAVMVNSLELMMG